MERTGGTAIRGLLICLTCVALLVALGGASLGQQYGAPGEGTDPLAAEAQVQAGGPPEIEIDADDITMRVELHENGTGQMEIEYTIRLDSDADRDAFEEIQSEIEANQSAYLDPFKERMNRTIGAAEETTGREMAAREFGITTESESQPQTELGHVRFKVEWSGFADVGDGRIRAGDAVDSLFLDESETLEFRWPADYGIESNDPRPQQTDAERIVWRGPINFEAGQPRIVLSTSASDGGTSGDDGSGDDGTGTAMLPLLGVAGLILLAAVSGFALFVQQTEGADEEATETPAGTDATPPAELLSNEERVLQLLQQNGGRMKQKQVAEQLDWTAAKTSQVVSDLRDDDEVDSFRLGRENVLTLPEVDIESGTADRTDTGDGGDSNAETGA